MFVNPGFEGLKIVSARKDGGREGVPIPKFVLLATFSKNESQRSEKKLKNLKIVSNGFL